MRSSLLDVWKQRRRRLKALLKVKKIDSWTRFVRESTEKNPYGFIYKLAAGKLKKESVLTTVVDSTGSCTESTESTLRVILDRFFKDECEPARPRCPAPCELLPVMERELERAELDEAVQSLDPRKAPGVDRITGDMVKECYSVLSDEMFSLYRACFKHGVFPRCWKVALVKLISKGKQDVRDPLDNMRPISLLPVLGRVLDRLLTRRVTFYVERGRFLSDSQYGFRIGRSCEDAVADALSTIERLRSAGNRIVVFSLDIAGAFDSARWSIILERLERLHMPERLRQVCRSFFSDRVARLEYKGVSAEKQLSVGTPQGSCCGPLFLNILFDELVRVSLPADCSFQAYADDGLLIVGAPTRAKLKKLAEDSLNRIDSR